MTQLDETIPADPEDALAPDPGFRIAEVRVQDLRAIRDLCVPLADLTVLVGENNVGKTTLLRALDIAIGTAWPVDDDLHVSEIGERTPRFEIDVKIVPADADEFSEPLAVRFGDAVRLPDDGRQFVALRTIGEPTSEGAGPRVQQRFLDNWACDRAAAADLVELERPNRDQLSLLSFFLLDARRDIVEELRQRTSHWGRLLSDVGISADDKAALEKQLETLGNEVIGKSSVLTTLRDELDRVRDALGSAVSAVSIEALPARIDEVARAVDVLLKAPGSAALPLRLQGMGSRSLAVVMVFQAYTQLRLGVDQDIRPLPFSAFEEPEAHLHPHPQRAMFDLIRELPGQKIISTHSPYVTQVTDLYDIRALRRSGSTISCRFVPSTHPDGSATFTADGLAKAQRFVQRNNGEVLFATCVVLCEGETEEGLLPVLAQSAWGKGVNTRGVSIVNAGGAQTFQHYVRVLEFLAIPWVVLVDGDTSGQDAVDSVGALLGRAMTPDELFMLPNGADIEHYLVNEGYRLQLEAAATHVHGPAALDEYRTNLDGQKRRGGDVRDYQASGWEDQLIIDFCAERMKTFAGGSTIGEQIVAAVSVGTQTGLPTALTDLLARVDTVLGAGG